MSGCTLVLLTGEMMPTTTAHCSCGYSGHAYTYPEDAELSAMLAHRDGTGPSLVLPATGSFPELALAFEGAGHYERAIEVRSIYYGPER